MIKQYTFDPIYWVSDRSTEVTFRPSQTEPPKEMVRACFVFAISDEGQVLMSRPARGWGLPGGHREGDESSKDCVRREVLEEAAAELGELELIGQWEAKKVFDSPMNEKYPDLSYQLLYFAKVTSLNPFSPDHETSERKLVSLNEVKALHHNFPVFKQIFDYVVDLKGLSV